jgi:hypothetical protein
LLLLKLPDRGILHVEGDGDGNISPMEKDRLEFSTGSVATSRLVLSMEGDTSPSYPIGVKGLLRPEMFDARSSTTSFEDPELMEVASKSVGSSLIPGTIFLGASFRLTTPLALRFREDPSLTDPTAWDLK